MFSNSSNLIFFFLLLNLFRVESSRRKIGHLQARSHGIKGTVYILSKDQILIQQFKFVGKGIVDFYVGTGSSTPSIQSGDLISQTQTGRFQEQFVEDLVLDLPINIPSDKIRWLAVYSHPTIAGEIIFPEVQHSPIIREASGAKTFFPNTLFHFMTSTIIILII